MKGKVSKIAVAALISACAALGHAAAIDLEGYTDSKTVTPGVWNTNFKESLAYAEANGIPVVMILAAQGCSFGNTAIQALNTQALKDWFARKKPVMIYLHPTQAMMRDIVAKESASQYKDLYEGCKWVRGGTGILDYPFFRVYWPGKNITKSFVGRNKKIPVTTPAGSGYEDIAGQLLGTFEKYLGAYVPGSVTPVTPVTPDPPAPPAPVSDIVDLSTLSASQAKAINAYLCKSSTGTLPLFASVDGAGVPVGTLTVKQTTKNKLTVTFAGTESKKLTVSTVWEKINRKTGEVTCSYSKSGTTLLLSLSAVGELSVTLDPASGYSYYPGELTGASAPAMSAADAAKFVGPWTAVLVSSDAEAGSGVMTFTVAKNGKVSWSGFLPDGTKVAGSSALSRAVGGASFVASKRTSKDYFAAVFCIAAETCKVALAEDSAAVLLHRDSAKAEPVESAFGAYGGAFVKNATPLAICQNRGTGSSLELVIDGEDVADITATASAFKFARGELTSFSYAKATGIFTVKAKFSVEGIPVTGTGKGVVLMTGSEDEPIGSGSFYGTVRINGKAVPYTLPLTLVPSEM